MFVPFAVALIGLLAIGAVHFVFLFVASRSRPGAAPLDRAVCTRRQPFFVFVVPCLNEAKVIQRSVERLLELPPRRFAVLVVDDGSDDGTGELVAGLVGDQVWLLSRSLPEARKGKGAALNAAYRHVLDSGLLDGRHPDDVVMTVLDADGRLHPNALDEVGPLFDDPRIGAVQVGVRMNNTRTGLLARLQDVEFVLFTDVFQLGRDRFGHPGLGGNGQFVRLSALLSLGGSPWSDCLTEDLDLGLLLLAGGWRTGYCPRSWVSQQAVTEVGRLLRQRTRWFQGHLQCWSRIPMLVRSRLSAGKKVDLLLHLISPVIGLVVSTAAAAIVVAVVARVAFGGGLAEPSREQLLLALVATYLISFGLAPLVAFVYWLRDRHTGFPRALLLAHLYQLYTYMWAVAGWRAVCRVASRRGTWAKTARAVEDGAFASATASERGRISLEAVT